MFPKGLGGLGDLGKLPGLLKQASEVKAKVEAFKDHLNEYTVEAASGGGMVTVIMTGRFEVVSLKIDPEVIDRNDPEMLETLVQAAVNEGVRKTQEFVHAKMQEITGNIEIPGLFGGQ